MGSLCAQWEQVCTRRSSSFSSKQPGCPFPRAVHVDPHQGSPGDTAPPVTTLSLKRSEEKSGWQLPMAVLGIGAVQLTFSLLSGSMYDAAMYSPYRVR